MLPNTLNKNKKNFGKYIKEDFYYLDFVDGLDYITSIYLKKDLEKDSKLIDFIVEKHCEQDYKKVLTN